MPSQLRFPGSAEETAPRAQRSGFHYQFPLGQPSTLTDLRRSVSVSFIASRRRSKEIRTHRVAADCRRPVRSRRLGVPVVPIWGFARQRPPSHPSQYRLASPSGPPPREPRLSASPIPRAPPVTHVAAALMLGPDLVDLFFFLYQKRRGRDRRSRSASAAANAATSRW